MTRYLSSCGAVLTALFGMLAIGCSGPRAVRTGAPVERAPPVTPAADRPARRRRGRGAADAGTGGRRRGLGRRAGIGRQRRNAARRAVRPGTGGRTGGPSTSYAPFSLDSGWKFIRQDVTGAQANAFDDAAWTNVSTPHTYNDVDTYTALISHGGGEAASYTGPDVVSQAFQAPGALRRRQGLSSSRA